MSSIEWLPAASLDILRQRQAILAKIRQFFTERFYLEVETPVMGCFGGTDVYLQNIKAVFRGQEYALQTSPEYHMKRLLAANSGPIFQLAKAFRDDELGRWHNPEFSMLEWYAPGLDHHGLMDEMDIFLQTIVSCPTMQRLSYREAFVQYCKIDPFGASLSELQHCLRLHGLDTVLSPKETDRDQYLFLLMAEVVERKMAEFEAPVAIYDFPLSQAALAQTRNEVAERFEVYYKGIELANGFHELCDPKAQELRFNHDNLRRKEKGLSEVAVDQRFLAALQAGLPQCSGVALGLDRLIALVLKQDSIQKVMAFPLSRA